METKRKTKIEIYKLRKRSKLGALSKRRKRKHTRGSKITLSEFAAHFKGEKTRTEKAQRKRGAWTFIVRRRWVQ